MRMWMIPPKYMCRVHLLGEHNEIHKFRHVFEKGYNIYNRILKKQIEPKSMEKRHNQLVKEMINRNYIHKSPYIQPDLSIYSKEIQEFEIDFFESWKILINRCLECSKIFYNIKF
jgi:hypothetical protein